MRLEPFPRIAASTHAPGGLKRHKEPWKGAVMRNRWEDKGGEVDEPVTITEKELRALKRGASVGVFALILSLVAVGAAGWTIYQGTMTTPVQPEAAAIPAATQAPVAADTATAQPAST